MLHHAYLEITNLCNRNCSFCPGTEREKGFLPPERFLGRIRKIRSYADVIHLHVLGEPLLHPSFPEMIRLCAAESFPVEVTTNGTLLTPENRRALLSETVRQVNFSLHSLHPEEESILDEILVFAGHAMKERPGLYLNFRLWNSGGNAADTWIRRKIRSAFGIPETLLAQDPSRHSRRLLNRLYLNQGPLFEWPGRLSSSVASPALLSAGGGAESPEEAQAEEKRQSESFKTGEETGKNAGMECRGSCYGLISQFAVLLDGTVTPCCLDSEGAVHLGNLDAEAELGIILSSPRARALRDGFLHGRIAEPFCRECRYRERFSKGFQRRNRNRRKEKAFSSAVFQAPSGSCPGSAIPY